MTSRLTRSRALLLVLLAGGTALASGCESSPASVGGAQPVYNAETGRLQALKTDTDGNGTLDAVAHMDGTTLKDIEIDRDGDGLPDRWEYYGPGVADPASANKFDRWAVITRAEEAARAGGPRTRREFYDRGILQRVEEDTNEDGRVDKWERYTNGSLAAVDLDLAGKGFASRRLIYGLTGDVDRIEQDDDGDGRFERVPDEEHRP